MEEWIGQRWHRFITQAADVTYPRAAVPLERVQRAIGMLFRAAGGDALVRVAPATAERIGGPRGWLQRVAGAGQRAALSTLDAETLALPPVLAVFDDAALNRDLYLWLAALSACHTGVGSDWIGGNLAATARALERFPGLRARYRRLAQAHLAVRPDPRRLRGAAATTEQALQQALRATLTGNFHIPPLEGAGRAGYGYAADPHPDPPLEGEGMKWRKRTNDNAIAPVWLWLHAHHADVADAPVARAEPADVGSENGRPRPPDARTQQDDKRRRAERTEDASSKHGLVMFFRAESILSWSEFVRVNRTGDDQDDQDASRVADDMEYLSIARDGQTLAARVKFDLDLPSASADDLPVGEGEPLPEWDYKRAVLLPERCVAQRLRARRSAPPDTPDDAPDAAVTPVADMRKRLKATSRQVRRRFEALRAAPRWQHGLTQGEELDLDAWVRFQVDRRHTGRPHVESPAVFSRRVKTERSLSTLMLADLSLSTDAYATQTARVIDLVRDSLYVFGNALDGVGDPFEMLGFSSVRRALRVHEVKRFGEPWNDAARQRVAAIKPGFYTRMGAAIRYGTRRLTERPERQKLLLILSDGKPNDLDQYEGRHGLEDTRHAVHAARLAGLVPFCVTIDQEARAYLPYLFGAQGYALVHRPQQLARALTQVYVRLTAHAR
ncbi:MAG: VWA domain-containing protein [Burkholderiaceae bacterium]|jgi:nitric oxide reductase NorD protein|nr:VWA domain-containing protein [Burkholderiaceae bacterium]